MRLVFIGDTHGKHAQLGTLSGDVLIHCGDFCDGFKNDGHSLAEIDDWFNKQHFDLILCIGGNHDFLAQSLYDSGKQVFKNAIYLEDSAYQFRGIRFYGSPWVPDLYGWAYFLPDRDRTVKWELIPDATDVLITHTPPLGVLDKPRSGHYVGCSLLRATVDRIRPKIHCFGHVHESRGFLTDSRTEFINATVVNSDIDIVYQPVFRDLDIDG